MSEICKYGNISTLLTNVKLNFYYRCFCGILSTKTIIFVTNSVKFMKVADCVILLKLVSTVKYWSLRSTNLEFTIHIKNKLWSFGFFYNKIRAEFKVMDSTMT